MATTFTLNGREVTVEGPANRPLLWALRDGLGVTGPKFGCGIAQCGACTVLLDGQPQRSCVLPVVAVQGAEVTTVEGLTGREAEAVRAAWIGGDVPQCGYCQSGQVVAATALLAANPTPADADIDEAMAGNLCRCATYQRIRQAIHDAAGMLET